MINVNDLRIARVRTELGVGCVYIYFENKVIYQFIDIMKVGGSINAIENCGSDITDNEYINEACRILNSRDSVKSKMFVKLNDLMIDIKANSNLTINDLDILYSDFTSISDLVTQTPLILKCRFISFGYDNFLNQIDFKTLDLGLLFMIISRRKSFIGRLCNKQKSDLFNKYELELNSFEVYKKDYLR